MLQNLFPEGKSVPTSSKQSLLSNCLRLSEKANYCLFQAFIFSQNTLLVILEHNDNMLGNHGGQTPLKPHSFKILAV